MSGNDEIIAGFQPGARPICVFCSAPWTDDMIKVFDIDAVHGEGSYDFGPENQRATVDIACESCKRLIYRKEFRAGVMQHLYPADMDQECVAICDALNNCPGIETTSSCCGHGKRPFHVLFAAHSMASLVPILKCAHGGAWRVEVGSNKRGDIICFMLKGPRGPIEIPGGASDFTARLLSEIANRAVMPIRVQRRRTKGWKMPPNTVSVTRPGPYGNPYRVGRDGTAAECVAKFRRVWEAAVECAALPPRAVPMPFNRPVSLGPLRGKNLACCLK